MAGKTVVVGLDGVPYQTMLDFAEKGIMENFAGLLEQGEIREMESSLPAVSSASWSSIITGCNPGEHGVYGFSDIIPGTYTLSFHNFNSLKKPAFWENNDRRHVILNVPSTYPAEEMNGYHVAGFVSPDLEKAVYPSSLLEELEGMDYRTDIDAEKGHKSKRLLFKELFDTLEARIKAYRHLWEKDWDLFKLVFTGTDRLGHFVWNAVEDEKDEAREDVVKFFRQIDEVIGEVKEKMDEEDSLLMLSDHGMESVKKNVNLNSWLEKGGFLELDENGERYNRIKEGSQAFALEHGRIYLNRKDRYPNGSVKEEEEKGILERLKGFLEGVEIGGEKVVDTIHTRNEIYSGPEVESGPDLVVVPKSGYNLRGKIGGELYEESPFQGMHNRSAFLFASGPIKKHMPEKPHVEDVAKMLNKQNEVLG